MDSLGQPATGTPRGGSAPRARVCRARRHDHPRGRLLALCCTHLPRHVRHAELRAPADRRLSDVALLCAVPPRTHACRARTHALLRSRGHSLLPLSACLLTSDTYMCHVHYVDSRMNALAEYLASEHGVRFVDVAAPSAQRPDGAMARFWPNAGARKEDCVHYCLPGVIDAWSTLLYNWMRHLGGSASSARARPLLARASVAASYTADAAMSTTISTITAASVPTLHVPTAAGATASEGAAVSVAPVGSLGGARARGIAAAGTGVGAMVGAADATTPIMAGIALAAKRARLESMAEDLPTAPSAAPSTPRQLGEHQAVETAPALAVASGTGVAAAAGLATRSRFFSVPLDLWLRQRGAAVQFERCGGGADSAAPCFATPRPRLSKQWWWAFNCSG